MEFLLLYYTFLKLLSGGFSSAEVQLLLLKLVSNISSVPVFFFAAQIYSLVFNSLWLSVS